MPTPTYSSRTPLRNWSFLSPDHSAAKTPRSHLLNSSLRDNGTPTPINGNNSNATTPTTTNNSNTISTSVRDSCSTYTLTPRQTISANSKNTDAIKVYVRLRSFNERERKNYIPTDLAVRMKEHTVEVNMPSRGRQPFTFDNCFWSEDKIEEEGKPYVSQEMLFDVVGRPLIENALEGFNSSIIAYGQTGSGKTYSVFGPPGRNNVEERGLIPRVCDGLFASTAANIRKGVTYSFHVSMLEIYLEDVFDLLNGRKKLTVRQDSTSSFAVVGSKKFQVTSFSEVMNLIMKGDSLKTFASTAINDRSSRAHTLFQLEMKSTDSFRTKASHVLLADLAGCERIKVAKTDSGTALGEACNINLSLLTLGTCIEAAVQRSRQGKSMDNMGEFRQSTLTKLLKDHIGGNSRTAILVAIAPHVMDVNLTLQALRFADRAKQIHCHAKINYEQTSPVISNEAIKEMYDKKRSLLEKECELEMVYATVKQKQKDFENLTSQLEEERRLIQERKHMYQTTDGEKKVLESRLFEIEDRLRGLSNDFNDSEKQRDDLEAKLMEVCSDNSVIISSKEVLEQRMHGLTLELDTLRAEQADSVLAQQIIKQQFEEKTVFMDAKFAAAVKEKENIINDFNAQRALSRTKIEHLENLVEKLTKELDEFTAQAEADKVKKAALLVRITIEEDEKEFALQRVKDLTTGYEHRLDDLERKRVYENGTMSLAITKGKTEIERLTESFNNLHSLYFKSTTLHEQAASLFCERTAELYLALSVKEDEFDTVMRLAQKSCADKISHISKEKQERLTAGINDLSARLRKTEESLSSAEAFLQAERERCRQTEDQLGFTKTELDASKKIMWALKRESEDKREQLLAQMNELKTAHAQKIEELRHEYVEKVYAERTNAKKEKMNEQLKAELLLQQCASARKLLEAAMGQYGTNAADGDQLTSFAVASASVVGAENSVRSDANEKGTGIGVNSRASVMSKSPLGVLRVN